MSFAAAFAEPLAQRRRYNRMMQSKIPTIDFRREAIEEARRMTFEQKFLAGPDLFDMACEFTKAGIRYQNPTFTEQQVIEELRRRIALGERLARREEQSP
jgi:hypothetical protein